MSEVSETLLTRLINESLREIFNLLGDNAYFLRKTQTLTVAAYPSTTTLPVEMSRLYKLEPSYRPGSAVDWRLIRKDPTGGTIIQADIAGTYVAHYLEIPADLSASTDTTALPPEHLEVLIVSVCRRLAQQVGNAALIQTYQAEESRLLGVLRRDCQKFDGMRHDALIMSRSQWGVADAFSMPGIYP